jgi:hypothetical protein
LDDKNLVYYSGNTKLQKTNDPLVRFLYYLCTEYARSMVHGAGSLFPFALSPMPFASTEAIFAEVVIIGADLVLTAR